MKVPNSPVTGKPMRVVYEPATGTYRGETYRYTYVSFRDDSDGESYTTTESDAIWLSQITNQYRAEHGIPFTDEIVSLRKRYGLSAAKMSVILGFGANQYRLYEDGEVPSESNGKMIRGAMNPRVFLDLVRSSRHQLTDREFTKITTRMKEIIDETDSESDDRWIARRLFNNERGLDNGFAPQSIERLKNLLLYILQRMGDTFQTKMNKVLFYIDFLSYRERGMAISGLAYNALEYGPVPQFFGRVYSAFDEIVQEPRKVREQESIALTSTTDADMSLFSEEELDVINSVCLKMKKLNAHSISELSHKEPAWQKYEQKNGMIPFEEAFGLVGV